MLKVKIPAVFFPYNQKNATGVRFLGKLLFLTAGMLTSARAGLYFLEMLPATSVWVWNVLTSACSDFLEILRLFPER